MSSTTRGSTPMSRSRTMHRCAASQPAGRLGGRAGGRGVLEYSQWAGGRTMRSIQLCRSQPNYAHTYTMHACTHARTLRPLFLIAQEVQRYWNARKPQLSATAVQRSYIEQVSHTPHTVSRPSQCMVSHPRRYPTRPAQCPTPHGVAAVPPRAGTDGVSDRAERPRAARRGGKLPDPHPDALEGPSGPVPYGARCTVHGPCHTLAAHCQVHGACSCHVAWSV